METIAKDNPTPFATVGPKDQRTLIVDILGEAPDRFFQGLDPDRSANSDRQDLPIFDGSRQPPRR
jgi:hypothetical protein